MDTTPTFADYLNYFFSGYRTAGMSAQLISFLAAIRYAILTILGAVLQGFINQLGNHNYTFDWVAIQGYALPAVIVVLGYVWKLVREVTNPFVTTMATANGTSNGMRQAPLRDVPPEM